MNKYVFFQKDAKNKHGTSISKMVFNMSGEHALLDTDAITNSDYLRIFTFDTEQACIMRQEFSKMFAVDIVIKMEIPSDNGVMFLPYSIVEDIGNLVSI